MGRRGPPPPAALALLPCLLCWAPRRRGCGHPAGPALARAAAPLQARGARGSGRAFGSRLQRPPLAARRASDRAAAERAEVGVRVRVVLEYEFEEAGAADGVELNRALEFVCGGGDVAPGLDEGIRGMRAGETRTLRFAAAGGSLFGGWDEGRVLDLPVEDLPPGHSAGDSVFLDGGAAKILRVDGPTATLDFNHPLAGRAAAVNATLLSCEAVESVAVRVRTLEPGSGPRGPRFGDRVTLRFEGASATAAGLPRGRPATFTVGAGDLPEGVEEGVVRMRLGERAEVLLPSARAPGGQPLAIEAWLLAIDCDLELAL